jgi:hypothetical protein
VHDISASVCFAECRGINENYARRYKKRPRASQNSPTVSIVLITVNDRALDQPGDRLLGVQNTAMICPLDRWTTPWVNAATISLNGLDPGILPVCRKFVQCGSLKYRPLFRV